MNATDIVLLNWSINGLGTETMRNYFRTVDSRLYIHARLIPTY